MGRFPEKTRQATRSLVGWLLAYLLALAIAALPSRVEADRCAYCADPECGGYGDAQNCVICRHRLALNPSALDSSESSRAVLSNGLVSCADWPDGWSTDCIDLTTLEEYRFTLDVFYEHEWAGAVYEVYFDGERLGRTEEKTSGWGAPNLGVPGALIGIFYVTACPGTHIIQMREMTMGEHEFPDACSKGMVAGNVRMTIIIACPKPFGDMRTRP